MKEVSAAREASIALQSEQGSFFHDLRPLYFKAKIREGKSCSLAYNNIKATNLRFV